jgi:hypothetical protein
VQLAAVVSLSLFEWRGCQLICLDMPPVLAANWPTHGVWQLGKLMGMLQQPLPVQWWLQGDAMLAVLLHGKQPCRFDDCCLHFWFHLHVSALQFGVRCIECIWGYVCYYEVAAGIP